ncbi:acyltransferase Pun1-like [Nicotiana tomentosiformis]|uniref:acyltransferase Pun1-like n=1 Tax=Nicotiana tomentosiformis TaxID=4098 RepID=UPI00051BD186|nr:acylsugar acyltransferase 3-like [Nicotiana tomentosiformis]
MGVLSRLHKLCLPGQAFTPSPIPLVFLYSKQQVDTIFPNGPKQQLSKFLEISLSKTLTCYYPWAGRLKDNATVECNDVGAEYFEVQINSPMDEVVHHSDSRIKDMVTFPQGATWGNCTDRALAIAQLIHFECGEIAISVCLSHKVGDGCSCYWFLRDGASLTRGPNAKIASTPYFVEDSVILSPLPDGPLVSPSGMSTLIYNSSREGDFNLSKVVADIRNSKQKLLSRDN